MPDKFRNRRERLVLLLVLIVVAGGLKLAFNPGLGRNSLDGDYYFQIARHVQEGDGMRTSVSLYHQGLKELPAPAHVYPLWPLLLGLVARVIGLWPAALGLPELLYLASLVPLYFFALRLARTWGNEPFVIRGGSTLDFGHLAVALFAAHPVVFQFTSLPYTEALAYLCAFSALLLLGRAVETLAAWRFALCGLLAAAAFATRSQMGMLGLAIGVSLAVVTVRDRRLLPGTAFYAVAGLLGLAPWIVHVVTIVRPFTPRAFLSVGAYRQTPEIEPFSWAYPVSSAAELWLNRLRGLGIAFDPRSPESYVASFGLVALLVPAAALLVLARRLRSNPRPWLAAWTSPQRVVALATLLAGAAMLLPIHLLHSRMIWEWRFAFRHGLPFFFLLLCALGYLLRQDGLRRVVLILVLLWLGGAGFRLGSLLSADFNSGLLVPESELVEWLEERPETPTVITTQAQPLSVYSRAGFHWMECRESSRKVKQLLAATGADYVLVYPHEVRCPFVQDLDGLELVRSFGEPPAALWLLAPATAQP